MFPFVSTLNPLVPWVPEELLKNLVQFYLKLQCKSFCLKTDYVCYFPTEIFGFLKLQEYTNYIYLKNVPGAIFASIDGYLAVK